MENQILWNHNDYEKSMISHIEDAALEDRVGESEVNSQNQNLETQTFQSDRSLFDTLARTNNFSEFLLNSSMLRYKKDGMYKLIRLEKIVLRKLLYRL